MGDLRKVVFIEDNGGRRLGLDRRSSFASGIFQRRDSGKKDELVWTGGFEKKTSRI